ncbi:MAG TPA: glucose-6-phosphate dehydrogenase assembly protein OpcA [Thermoanaerobaculia bacterium]|nr:glucose-6-phosphate dehydrogenase assembly protein OpcA [Thermoanaerobaculia bacterium]
MATAMNDVAVDVSKIEKELADLWRAEQRNEDRAVTKAALWNVIAHTWTSHEHARATEVLARSSAAVPQRTIVVHADPHEYEGEISSWISANCHLVGGGQKQVCSEEVSIVASGERVSHVPPLVKALLLPDMPVAVWWIGDLPDRQHGYVETLLDPADRLIVDSAQFNGGTDLELVSRIAEQTTTAPADLNWARIEEWRAATAAVFDPPPMRERLHRIKLIRVRSGGGASFGAVSQALLYVAWLQSQTGTEPRYELVSEGETAGMVSVEIHQDDDSIAMIRRNGEHGVVTASSDGAEMPVDCVTRALAQKPEDLIVRLLKRPEADRVYLKTLKIARRLAR